MLDPVLDDDRVWRALSDVRRRGMLDMLSRAPMRTGDLVDAFRPLSRTGVMKHLDVLVAAGLVLVRWEGRVRWNHFNPLPVDRICRRWLDARRSKTSAALHRLKEVAEARAGAGNSPAERETDHVEQG